ncbi:MAG: hypothetical protein A3C79_00265 [Candidatus Taylorbacteria bacterium RIFCSPHIGHO2_02_FULL_45_28]|nr:MAG: hypothetical protein A3C79_00265 [Candidatus Taylorbacteria bacterium RIFCSPHIGHO2_02_FULL_45_28]
MGVLYRQVRVYGSSQSIYEQSEYGKLWPTMPLLFRLRIVIKKGGNNLDSRLTSQQAIPAHGYLRNGQELCSHVYRIIVLDKSKGIC